MNADTSQSGGGAGTGGTASRPRSMLRSAVWRCVRFVLICYVAVSLFLYVFQRRLQYFPVTSNPSLPAGADGLEEFTTTTDDGVAIRGWYWPGPKPLTIVIFHGNGGHRGHRFEWLRMLRDRLGVTLCMPDYRGYGGSGGSPTEDGLYRDAEATLAWLRGRGASSIIYMGESLGTGVAVELARRHPPRALILQSAFSSCAAVAQHAYPFAPVGLLMKDRYDSAAKIGDIACRILMIHGDADRIIPMIYGRALFEAARQPKEWLTVAGADHNDLPWVGGARYLDALEAFVGRVGG